jgi:hypothetical protein
MPILTLLSDQPVLFLGKTVHFVQIVAGRVVQSA